MAKSDLEDFVKRRPPMFWWFLANVVAIALAITSWQVCLNLFRDPTHPTSYQLMLKVGRIQPLEKFTPTTAPSPRKTSTPLSLEAEFQRYREEELKVLNQELKRAYLTNYRKNLFLTYVTGEFQVIETRPLTEDDFFPSGTVVRAQAMVRPDDLADPIPYPVFIEYLLPGTTPLSQAYAPKDILELKKIPHCAAVLNVGEIGHDRGTALYLSIIPLCAPEKEVTPPEAANVAAAFPVFQ